MVWLEVMSIWRWTEPKVVVLELGHVGGAVKDLAPRALRACKLWGASGGC